MTFSQSFVRQKLESLESHSEELRALLVSVSDEEFFSDSGKLHIAERLVQLIVDAMIDTNQHFIKELDLEISDDLRGTFLIMGENGILPENFARKIAPVTGVRNILVHQYEKLEKEMFIRNLRAHFSDFTKYRQHIDQYLNRQQD